MTLRGDLTMPRCPAGSTPTASTTAISTKRAGRSPTTTPSSRADEADDQALERAATA